MANNGLDSNKIKDVDRRLEDMGKTISNIAYNYTQPLQILIDKFSSLGGTGKLLAGVFTAVGVAISTATEASKKFYTSLNSIKGINGHIGDLAKAITTAATGSVTRQDIADFLKATGELFQSTTAIEQNASFINNLIGLYGDVNLAVMKFNEMILLSSDSQKQFAEYAERANKIIQQTPAARLQATSNALKEIVVTLGNDLLYVLKPVLTVISGITDAIRRLNNATGTQGLTEAEAYKQLQKLAKEYGVTLEELNQIERGTFVSSLDEVTSAGQGILGEDNVFAPAQEDASALNDTLVETTPTMQNLIDLVSSLWHIISTIFDAIGPPFIEILAGLTDIVSAFVDWANAAGILKPILMGVLGVILGIKAAQLGQAIASIVSSFVSMVVPVQTATTALWANAGAGIAAAGASSMGIAVPIIVAAIGAGLAALGIASSVGSVSTQGSAENEYSGVGQDVSDNANVTLYIDGDKVNSALDASRRSSGKDSQFKVV